MNHSRHRILFALVLATLVTGCGGEPVPRSELGWKDELFQYEGRPFTGTSIEFYKDGTTKKGEIEFSGGQYHGVVREWWENGNLQTETNFSHGKRHGKNTYWDEDGKLIKEQVYDMDEVTFEKVHQ